MFIQNFYIYILKCSDGSYYIGHTDNIEQRVNLHQSGKIPGYTSKRLPVSLVFSDVFSSRDDAFNAERKLKKWSRGKKEALISGDIALLKLLSKKKFK